MKLGRKLGAGKWRAVYEHPHNRGLIVKRLLYPDRYPNKNALEWAVWQAVKDTDFSVHFCPCVDLTEDNLLVMVRCAPAQAARKRNLELMGVTLTDSVKKANLGRINGRTVLTDYGKPPAMALVRKLQGAC